jgi:hypothetical protein
MSKNSKPTIEELKQVYKLMLEGYEDADILGWYQDEARSGTLVFPLRTDRRFVRDRRRELTAAQEVLKNIGQKVDQVTEQNKKQHFEHLAEIAELLLDGGLGKINDTQPADKYEIVHEDYVIETLTRDQLIGTLEGNIDIACQRYGAWQVFGCLMTHLEAEYPIFQDVYGFINEHPLEYIEMLRTLAQRKTFKGTCPVCKDW